MSDNFPTAYRRARQKAGEAAWSLLSNDQRAEAVTSELRLLEAESCTEHRQDSSEPN